MEVLWFLVYMLCLALKWHAKNAIRMQLTELDFIFEQLVFNAGIGTERNFKMRIRTVRNLNFSLHSACLLV